MAFLLDEAVVAHPPRVAQRSQWAFTGLHPHWIRLMAIGINLGLWALIVMTARQLIG